MNIEQFLVFWDAHNVVIIEALIVSILFAVAFLTYHSLFGKKSAENEGGASLDTVQIEKTLQKILDASAAKPAAAGATHAASAAGASAGEMPAGAAEAIAEVAQLRQAVQEKQAQIEQLKVQAEAAVSAGAVAGAPAGGVTDVAALSGDEKNSFEAKIRDLEARLSEYEIISEDIADLSRYKEENTQLQKELEALKAGGGSPGPAAAAPAAPVTPAAPAAAPAAAAAPTPAPEAPPQPVAAAPVVEPVAAPTPAPPAAAAEPVPEPAIAPAADLANVVDDDLMKEFAAAVEGQKAAPISSETDKLMNDFENFIKKG